MQSPCEMHLHKMNGNSTDKIVELFHNREKINNVKNDFTCKLNGKNSLPSSVSINFDFLSTQSSLLSDETHNFHEELYSVEQNELLPISSLFLVPGIYRKIGLVTAQRDAAAKAPHQPQNVFLTEQACQGRIVPSNKFPQFYAKLPDNEEAEEHCLPKVHSKAPKQQPSNKSNDSNNISASNNTNNDSFDALARIALNILKFSSQDLIVIDRKRNEVVRTERHTNQKTIYRFLSPQTVHLKPKRNTQRQVSASNGKNYALLNANGAPIKLKLKLGRPRKKPPEEIEEAQSAQVKSKVVPPVVAPPTEPVVPEPATEIRTRSGRLVKSVKPATDPAPPPLNSTETLRSFLAEFKDSDYRCSSAATTKPPTEAIPPAESAPGKRRVPPEAICPTCNKIFLGRRLQRHFTQHPDHMLPTTTATENNNKSNCPTTESNGAFEQMSLFRFLLSKLQKPNLSEDQRAELFLNEINDLVQQLQLRSSRLIRNTSGLHLVSPRSARVLGIPEGQYALDMSAMDVAVAPEPESNYEHMNGSTLPAPSSVSTRCLDYTTLSMSLDDTLTDEAVQKLNLSAGGKLLPPSEESLLRAVEVDFAPAEIQKIAAANLLHAPTVRSSMPGETALANLVPHYDNASDNAVEAVSMKETTNARQSTPMLDLSVDFFQFNNN